jgi:hypothetical protein
VSIKSGLTLRRTSAVLGRVCRRGTSAAPSRVLASVVAVAIVALFTGFMPETAAAATYYVDSVNGSDSSSGTSDDAAWKSLDNVNRAAFRPQPGDAIFFKRNSVWTGTLKVHTSGSATAPIIYMAYGTGAAPRIKNPDEYYGTAIDVTGRYNVIQDFFISDAHEAGVKIEANAVSNVVRYNEITRTGSGVMIKGKYNLATGNYVHDLSMIVNDRQPWNDYGAVCFWLEGDNNEIASNTGIRCKAGSYDFGHDGGFVEVFRNGDYAYIHHNWVQDTNGFFELGAVGGGSAKGIRVAYNVIVDVTGPGSGTSVCFNAGSYDIDIANFRFENNTFVSTSADPDAYRVFGCRNDLSALKVRNNIFYSDIQIANNGNFEHRNNIYYMINMVNGHGVGYSLTPTESFTNPLFRNAAGDFNLLANSPAIDAGMDLNYTGDYGGSPLPPAVIPDIGAYEFKR